MNRGWILGLLFLAVGCPATQSSGGGGGGTTPTGGGTTTDPPSQLAGWACYQVTSQFGQPISSCHPSMAACEEQRASSADLDRMMGEQLPCEQATSAFCFSWDLVGSSGEVYVADQQTCHDDGDECNESRRTSAERDDRGDVSACVDVSTGAAIANQDGWACFARSDGETSCWPSMPACEDSRSQSQQIMGGDHSSCESAAGVYCFDYDFVMDSGQVVEGGVPMCARTGDDCEVQRASMANQPNAYANITGCAAR